MQNKASKPGENSLSGDKKRNLIVHYVAQLAMALGQTIPAERALLYVRALSDLTDKQLEHGFECALKYFRQEFGKVFPMPGDLREWALQWHPEPITDSSRILDRGDKPEDWEPMSKDEAREFIRKIREASKLAK